MGNINWKEYEKRVRKWVNCNGGNDKGETFFRDGIICPELWNEKENIKILFILKEMHDNGLGKKTDRSWLDIRDINDMRDIYEETTWRKVSTLAYGINCAIKKKSKVGYQLFSKPNGNYEKSLHYENIRKIAIINMKKLGGDSSTNGKKSQKTIDWSKHGEIFVEELKKQIENISPKIIVCCGPDVFTIFNSFLSEENKSKIDSYYDEVTKRIIINGFHPKASKSIEDYYVKPINNCIRLWNENK